jgi:hypothetical protein
MVKFSGPTSIKEYGTWRVSNAWINEYKKTIQNDNAVILLVERLEGKDVGRTHYLFGLGYEEKIQKNRRNRSPSISLLVKDPTEGNDLLCATMWYERSVELCTKQTNGKLEICCCTFSSSFLKTFY